MFDNYSYKQKCIALGIIFLMLSAAAYKRSFKSLFDAMSENETLANKSQEYRVKSKSMDSLMKDIATLDNMLGKENVSKEEVQQGIVSFVGVRHQDVSIHDLQPIHSFIDGNFKIVTNQLDVTGTVNQLLKTAYDFERNFKLSRVVSMSFYTIKNNKSEVLHLKIFFQNYENTK